MEHRQYSVFFDVYDHVCMGRCFRMSRRCQFGGGLAFQDNAHNPANLVWRTLVGELSDNPRMTLSEIGAIRSTTVPSRQNILLFIFRKLVEEVVQLINRHFSLDDGRATRGYFKQDSREVASTSCIFLLKGELSTHRRARTSRGLNPHFRPRAASTS
jgi:hypothetical protein